MHDQPTPRANMSMMPLILTALLSTCFTLMALIPVAYLIWQQMPPPLVTIDLQKVVEANQSQLIHFMGAADGNVTEEKRVMGERMTAEFAQRLSRHIEQLGAECRCVIINKAALLSGAAPDYTGLLMERMKP